MSTRNTQPAPEPLWPRFLVFPLFAAVGQVILIAAWPELSVGWRAAAIAVLSYAWFCVAGCFHELGHLSLFANQRLSVWTGRVIGTFLVIPFTLFRATHMFHHSAMNTPRDFEMWPYCEPRRSLRFRRWFALFDVIGGAVAAPIIYGRIMFVSNSPLSAEERRSARWEYVGAAAFWGGVAAVVTGLLLTDRVTSSQLSWWWLSPLAFASTLNTLRKFLEHVGLGSLDPMLGTRTVKPNNPLTRAISYFNFDINIHGPHHRHGSAKHYELPEKLESCLNRQPEARDLVFPTYTSAMLHALQCIIRNPGVGETITGPIERKKAA